MATSPSHGTEPRQGDALVLVDVQVDFLPGGTLGVAEGDQIIPVLNDWIRAFEARGLPIYATRDWHPPDHCSFKPQGGIWPPHCVADTAGAAFAPGLELPAGARVISKATSQDTDAYSGFQGTDLEAGLRRAGVTRLIVGGLATDYCVLQTVLDGLEAGFQVEVLRAGVRAVNLDPEDGPKALERMQRSGAHLC